LAIMSKRGARDVPEERRGETRIIDPRAVRVAVAAAADEMVDPIVIEPPEVPVAPRPHVARSGLPDGLGAGSLAIDDVSPIGGGVAMVDGSALRVRLDRLDEGHGLLTEVTDDGPVRTSVLLLPPGPVTGPSTGVVRREIVVDGWRIEVEIESERRAALRDRARRGRETAAHGGPTHVRAIIPGRIVSVSVVPGDPVEAGQQLLVVEAMKMQNELRAPRDGIVSSVAVGAGGTIEVGDLLLVLE
jgi:biotin carboxyl carrier protein